MKTRPVPGIHYVLKEYHSALLIVLEEWKQTQTEAATELGISLTTFRKILRLQSLPNFQTPRGKVLAQRFERWSTLRIEELFPEAFFTKEFLMAPKTHRKTLPFRLLGARSQKTRNFTLALPAPPQTAKSTRASRRKKRKKKSSV